MAQQRLAVLAGCAARPALSGRPLVAGLATTGGAGRGRHPTRSHGDLTTPERDLTTLDIDAPRGLARAHLHRPIGAPSALVLLLHGAGTDTAREPLPALADALAGAGVLAARFDQPYVVTGQGRRRPPAPAAHLDEALLAALPTLRALAPGVPLAMVGRSSGARVACRTAAAARTSAIAALGFPWRPPGRAANQAANQAADRGAELRAGAAVCSVLVVQGERDPFGRPTRTRGVRVRVVPGMAHTPTEAAARLAGHWLLRRLREAPTGNSHQARGR